MTDDSESAYMPPTDGSVIFSGLPTGHEVHWTSSQCAGQLRIYNGRLQQLWITQEIGGTLNSITEEWRDVPVVNE